MLTLQAILLTSSLLIVLAMVGSVILLATQRGRIDPVERSFDLQLPDARFARVLDLEHDRRDERETEHRRDRLQ